MQGKSPRPAKAAAPKNVSPTLPGIISGTDCESDEPRSGLRRFCRNPVGGLALIGIFLVMGFFSWTFYGLAQNLDVMTRTMLAVAQDLRTMAQTQQSMAASVERMQASLGQIDGEMETVAAEMEKVSRNMRAVSRDVNTVSANFHVMNSHVGRLGYDVNRGARAWSSPFGMMRNMMGSP